MMPRYQNRSTKSTRLRLPRFEPTFLPANKSGSTPRLWSPRIICRSLPSTTPGPLWCGSIQLSKPKARSRTLPLVPRYYEDLTYGTLDPQKWLRNGSELGFSVGCRPRSQPSRSVMRYLLDSNIVSDLVRNPQGKVAARIAHVGEESVCTSLIVAAERR